MTVNEQLVLQFQAGDREAFADLVNEYRNYVAAVTYSATGDFGRSEEIAQQAFVVAWQKRETLREPAKWLGWLRGITRNLLREDFRKQGRPFESSLSLEAADPPVDEQPLPEQQIIDEEQAELLWSVLGEIPENYREPLVLFYREGKSVANVAKLLDLSEDAVKQRLARGRKMLKAEISQLVEDTLFNTQPDSRFSAAVLAAIPAVTGATTAKAGGSILGGLLSLKFLAFLLGPLIGIAGAIFGSKKSLDSATSQVERKYIWSMIFWTSLLVLSFMAIMLVLAFEFPALSRMPLVQILVWGSYIILLLVLISVGNRRIAEIKKRHGTKEERAGTAPATQMGRPVTTLGLRANMLGSVIGPSIAFFLLCGLAQDWLFFVLLTVSVGTVVAWLWTLANQAKTVPQQIRYNALAILVLALVLAGFAMIRWDVWSERFPVQPNLPGWTISLFFVVLAAGIGTALFIKASRLEQLSQRDNNS